MSQPSHSTDDRIRPWTLQRELVRASLAAHPRGHVLAPIPGREAAAPSRLARPRKRA